MQSYDTLVEKWSPVLNNESAGEIKDSHRRAVTAAVLENQEIALREEGLITEAGNFAAAGTTASGGAASNWNPVLIALVRRAMPNLMAYDVCGVQPMTGPTGLIFAMKSRFNGGQTSNTEALYNEADTAFSGDSSVTQPSSSSGLNDSTADVNAGIDSERTTGLAAGGMPTANAEKLGSTTSTFNEMGFTIEKATVTAKSRALKAEYSLELAQDLKAIHGLDAETELANILSTEILAEINREVIRTINSQAKTGAGTSNTALNGVFNLDTDADGRWSVEKFKGLIVQIEREANQIAKDTRRGKGNFIMCSSDVA